MALLPAVEVETGFGPATASVIWLHGLGADGNDFAPLVPELNLPPSLSTRFIFPHAPAIAITVNGGYVMPAWYDILEMSLERKVDELQLRKSAQQIQALIEREIARGIASNRIILAGFSQGGAVALEAALSYSQPLAGLLVMSSYFATSTSVAYSPANANLPILLQHGVQDSVVSELLGQKAYQLLRGKHYRVEYQPYDMDHTLCAEQVQHISTWLQVRLGVNTLLG